MNMSAKKVAVVVGSLRRGSFNRKTANALIGLAPATLECELVDIGALPLYNQDIDEEGKVPAAWLAFRQQLRAADAVLFVTPEYNRSVPGVLKNAIDIGSRPFGQSVWKGKPAGIVSVSTGVIGGFGANHHLRQSLVFLDMPAMQQPEAYVGNAAHLFDGGNLVNESTREFLKKYIDAFAAWVRVHTAAR